MTDGANRVLVVQATSNSSPSDLVPMAERVTKELRRLYYGGYDLINCEVRCVVLRNERRIKPGAANFDAGRDAMVERQVHKQE